MNLQPTPEQAAFREEVRRFIRERLPTETRDHIRRGHAARPQDIITWQRILNERGWAAPHWPKAYGGAGLGIAERLILLEEQQRACAPQPLPFNIAMLGPVLLRFGTEEQKRYFLPKLANLDLWFCQGFSEPGAGSDLASLRTRAVRQGDEYVVDGQKTWTTMAHAADWIFALVRTENAARKQDGISFLLIDLKSPGVTVRPIVSIDGEHHLNEVFFDSVRVPAANLVGEEGRGWDCAKFLLSSERTSIANVGQLYERLERAHELAARIRQADGTLAEDAKLAAELAELGAEIRALDITNWRFLLDPTMDKTLPGFASVLKLKGSELAQAVTALIARLAGPAGLEHQREAGGNAELAAAVPRYFFYRATSIYGGSSEVQKDILAKTLLG